MLLYGLSREQYPLRSYDYYDIRDSRSRSCSLYTAIAISFDLEEDLYFELPLGQYL
jgi:hypothetical protein